MKNLIRHPGESRGPSPRKFYKWFKEWIPAFAGMTMIFCSSVSFANPPDVGPIPKLDFHPPTPTRHVLSNGIIVYVLEDHELPVFHLNLRFKMTPADEHADKRGTIGLLDVVWRTGGTLHRTPEELNDELETKAISIETSAGEEAASVSVSCLSDDQTEALSLFKEVLLEPSFRPAQLKIAKEKILEGILRKNDNPWNIGRRAFRDIQYGPTHFYAWNPTPASVAKITREDLIELHKKVLDPHHAYLSVTGNFDTAAMLATLENLIGSWKLPERKIPDYDYSLRAPSSGTVFFVDKDLTQSVIYTGGIGIRRHDPDVYAMSVTNSILGEGGPSRLFTEVRSKLGLAYMVASFYTERKGPGLVGAACQTKAATTSQALAAMQKELLRLGAEPVEPQELSEAKDSLLNTFIFRFKSAEDICEQKAELEFFDFEPDYLEKYPGRIEAIDQKMVREMARKYYSPERFKILVVGSRLKVSDFLKAHPEIVEIPLKQID